MSPDELRALLGSGLLSFPVTDFDARGDFDPASYRARLEWLAPYGARALFAAGGTGEFFSLEPREYGDVVRCAVESGGTAVPILAGCGGPTRLAIAFAQEAERLGAAGLLLMPHYLVAAGQAGLVAHVEAVCRAVRIGVVVYNRDQCRLEPPALLELAGRCPNLVGLKDGIGDVELMVRIRRSLGDRLAYVGGLPTAEVFAAAYRALGVPVYSSAVFNFVPRTAMEFYRALQAGDDRRCGELLDRFFLPLIELRSRGAGYAVSMIKAGVALVGRPAGPVRPPLTELKPEERERLAALIERLGPQ
jgi:5-dehydro-4-deoxyglucarate dehydratase